MAVRAQIDKGYEIRPMASGDEKAARAVASLASGAAQWSTAAYERVAKGDFDGWVATTEKGLIGLMVTRLVADELEILNLAVDPEHHRRGVATRLLAAALESARGRGGRRAFLEVRESNAGAIAFYRRRGFAPAGRRRRYYADPPEDALVLSRQLEGDLI